MFVLTHIIIESVQYARARVAFTRPASNMTSERTAPWVVLVGADPQSTGVLTIFWASKEFRRRRRAEMVAQHCRSLLNGVGFRPDHFSITVEGLGGPIVRSEPPPWGLFPNATWVQEATTDATSTGQDAEEPSPKRGRNQ